MRLMTAEKIIELLDKNGIQLRKYGNINANISNDHPIMRLFKLHLDIGSTE